MKDIPHPQLLSKFGPKSWKSLVAGTCSKNLYYQKRHFGPLGVNPRKSIQNSVKKHFRNIGNLP